MAPYLLTPNPTQLFLPTVRKSVICVAGGPDPSGAWMNEQNSGLPNGVR